MSTKRTAPKRKTRRTVNLLRLFAAFLRRKRSLSINDIARVTGCSVRTAYRLIVEMRDAGLIKGDGTSGFRLRVLSTEKHSKEILLTFHPSSFLSLSSLSGRIFLSFHHQKELRKGAPRDIPKGCPAFPRIGRRKGP